MLKLLTLRQRGERMYFKTTVIAGKTIEVMKGYKRRVAKVREQKKTGSHLRRWIRLIRRMRLKN